MPHKVSIVINTYNRGALLDRTLKSLYYLDYPDFEAIVVNGPSTDDTAEVLKKFRSDVKTGSCPAANLSMSRNIGICMSKGDIVAFIDDDAIPEPEWLTRIVSGYDDAEVGAVGGPVYNHTGYELQCRYIICNRFGDARMEYRMNPTEYFNFPLANAYCGLIGTNSTFRRDVLMEVKGFDEEYDYFLDETDLCIRIVDAGYKVRFVDGAYVHHKFAPSHIRNEKKMVLRWFPIAKNKTYFSIRHTVHTHAFSEVLGAVGSFSDNIGAGLKCGLENGSISEEQYLQCRQDLTDGIRQGFADAFSARLEMITGEKLGLHDAPYRRFPNHRPDERLVVCLISQDFPPEHNGGIGRFTHDLAKGIAALGHGVHVISRGKGHSTVDFEDGVWVHRLVSKPGADRSMLPGDLQVPDAIWDHAFAVYEEAARINTHRRIDVVEAPIWDVEGLACILDKDLLTVVNLETTYSLALQSHKEWQRNPDYKRNHIDKVINAERFVFDNAPAFHAISSAIVEAIEKESGAAIPRRKVGLVPLGVVDRSGLYAPGRADGKIRVLFVGRLEYRKGIDVLLECAPAICERHPDVKFVIVGDDRVPDENGRFYREEFLRKHAGSGLLERVVFTGRVGEDELYGHYADCDIFVAPSRFESFGLIFLEAMQFAKPVIGCNAGGMVEIIRSGSNGLLAEPGDAESLSRAIEDLVSDADKRRRFGEMSRRIFVEHYTVEKMAEKTVDFYMDLLGRKRGAQQGGVVRDGATLAARGAERPA